jgi:MOSC domain-containing protein YiiM
MSIEGIFLSPRASLPMQSVNTGTLMVGKGLEFDRYCTLAGTYSHIRASKIHPGQREPGRQLTIMSADSVESALKQHGLPVPTSLGDLRRNIVVRGLSSESLLAAVGKVVQLGPTCRVLVHRQSVPCMYNERKNCIPGMMEAIWNEAGVSCEILTGGPIGVGDIVEIIEDETVQIDDGNQPPGYFVPPSRRTAEMVRDAIKTKREEKKKLLETDPEGVERVEASYGTVGLTFWPREKA